MPQIRRMVYNPNDNREAVVSQVWPFKNDEVVICIDAECHCFNQTWAERRNGIVSKQRRVCEVGFTVLDTTDVANLPAGDRLHNVWGRLKPHNFGIKEHIHRKSGAHTRWCNVGCAEDFMYGRTQWVGKGEFRDAFVANVDQYLDNDGYACSQKPPSSRIADLPESTGRLPIHKRRPVVFIMFGQSDISWLKDLGLDLTLEYPYAKVLDIQRSDIALSLGNQINKPNIGALDLFGYLGIQTQRVHNGGNDALYEMQAFLAPFAMTSEQWQKVSTDEELPALPPIWDILGPGRRCP